MPSPKSGIRYHDYQQDSKVLALCRYSSETRGTCSLQTARGWWPRPAPCTTESTDKTIQHLPRNCSQQELCSCTTFKKKINRSLISHLTSRDTSFLPSKESTPLHLTVPETLQHAMIYCSGNNQAGKLMLTGLQKCLPNLTPEKILTLNFEAAEDQQFPLVWCIASFLSTLWHLRVVKKAGRTNQNQVRNGSKLSTAQRTQTSQNQRNHIFQSC